MTRISSFTLGTIAAVLLSGAAGAATIQVQCEQRGLERSRISVDAKSLSALPHGLMLKAQAVSGANVATSAAEPLRGDSVEFDFDSNPRDIAQGATAIGSDFIVGGSVTGKIMLPDGSTLIADTVACRVRSR